MNGFCNIAFMDKDWVFAARLQARMSAYASFAHTVNFVLPHASPTNGDHCPSARYYCDAHGDMVRDAYLWIGSKSCDCAPGALIIDSEELPSYVREAHELRITEEGEGRFVIFAFDDQGCCRELRAMMTRSSLDDAVLDFMPDDRCAFPSEQRLRAVRKSLLLHGRPQSPFVELFGEERLLAEGVRERLVSGGRSLCETLASSCADSRAASASLAQLVGLGIGLTPSGDDFIIGALAIGRALALPEAVDGLTSAMDGLAQKTTLVSRHYLMSAVRGRFSKNVLDVVKFLFDDEDSSSVRKLTAACESLLNHGSTSGTDTLAGMLAMLEACSRRLDESAVVL